MSSEASHASDLPDLECIQGSPLYYCAAGNASGRSLIFLHGWGADHRYFDYQLAAFREYSLIIPDLDGFGSSSSENVPRRFSIKEQAEKVFQLARSLEVESALLIGHSMGGMIAQELALSHPEFVNGLILEDTSPGLRHLPRSNILSMFGSFIYGAPRPLRQIVARNLAISRKHASDAVVGIIEEYARVTCCKVLVRYVKAMRKWSSLERLDQLSIPTLIIRGDEDTTLGEGHTELLGRNIPSSRSVVIPECGHSPHLERPDSFNAEVHRFLSETVQW